MKIERITVCPVMLGRKERFGVRTGGYDALPNVYVRIDTDEGATGYGEAAPIEDYYGDTQGTIVAAIRDYYAPALLGENPFNINVLMARLDRILPANPCAKAGIDIALHDLKGKALGWSVAELLGGRFHERIPLTVSIGIDEPERTDEKIRDAAEAGFSIIKLKGGADVGEDVETLARARRVLGETGPWLRIDANAGYRNPSEIWRHLPRLEELRIALFEQPFPRNGWTALRALRDRMNIPILLDESMQTGDDLHQVALSPAGFVANIKLQNSGGFLTATQLVYAAARLGIPVMIGSQRESHVGNTASIHLAALVELMDYTCDQRYAHAVPEEVNVVTNAPDLKGPNVAVPTGSGLGVDVDWDRVKRIATATEVIAA